MNGPPELSQPLYSMKKNTLHSSQFYGPGIYLTDYNMAGFYSTEVAFE